MTMDMTICHALLSKFMEGKKRKLNYKKEKIKRKQSSPSWQILTNSNRYGYSTINICILS